MGIVNLLRGATVSMSFRMKTGQFMFQSSQDGMVAKAGGGQTGATPVTNMCARVITVATTGDSVVLPAAVAGNQIDVINAATNSMNVFAPLGGMMNSTLNGSQAIAGGKVATFYSTAAGTWHAQLGA